MKKLKVQKRPRYSKGKLEGHCKGWYIRPTSNGKTTWVYLSDNKAEAERLAKDYSRQDHQRECLGYTEEADINLSIDMYLKHKETELTTKKSIQRYTAPMRKFQVFLEEKNINVVSSITKTLVLEYLNGRTVERTGEPLAEKTWNVEREILNNFFNYCAEEDRRWILKNPITFKPKNIPDPIIVMLCEDEVPLFLKAVKELNHKVCYYELISTIAYTGARVGEAVRIFKEDVDLKKRFIRIAPKRVRRARGIEDWKPKDKDIRYLPIPDPIVSLVENQMKTPTEFLFPNSKGNMILERRVLEVVNKVCSRIGIKVINTHSLRHSFCSISISKGQPEKHVQEVLGHKSNGMTRRYTHLAPEAVTDRFKGLKYGEES